MNAFANANSEAYPTRSATALSGASDSRSSRPAIRHAPPCQVRQRRLADHRREPLRERRPAQSGAVAEFGDGPGAAGLVVQRRQRHADRVVRQRAGPADVGGTAGAALDPRPQDQQQHRVDERRDHAVLARAGLLQFRAEQRDGRRQPGRLVGAQQQQIRQLRQ
nr:hypothetical protein [Catenulispora pinisilvae]